MLRANDNGSVRVKRAARLKPLANRRQELSASAESRRAGRFAPGQSQAMNNA
jgi:hypothetical protein